MTIGKAERDKLIGKISRASGIARYALDKKMSNEQLTEAVQHLDVLQLIKDANNYNRYIQAQKTQVANDKLKEFINIQNSEVIKAGKWLLNALSKGGKERKDTLSEQSLVHKEDYNETVSGLRDTIHEVSLVNEENTKGAENTIKNLEGKIDTLKHQLQKIKEFITNNYGTDTWKNIKKYSEQ